MSRRLLPLVLCISTSVAGAYGCGAALAQPTERDAAYAARRWPGTTLSELRQGRALFVRTCAGCHTLKAPSSHTPSQWRIEVEQMRGKNGVTLDDRQAELIVRYLSAISARQQPELAER